MSHAPLVGIVMGSDSDWPVMEQAALALEEFGVPYEAARAILFGHTWIALTNGLRGSHPFSDACHIAMDYGRESIIKDDWKKMAFDRAIDVAERAMKGLTQS